MANILVLDDVVDAGILLKKILEKKGHKVAAFSEEEEAIKFAANNPIELVILDIKLKKMTGIDVLEEMKKSSPTLKAIMLTGYPTIETARQAVELGAVDYCVKPIDKEELEEKVNQALKSV